MFGGDFLDKCDESRIVVRSDADDGTGAEFEFAIEFWIRLRRVACEGDIDADAEHRIDSVGGDSGAEEAEFLLGRADEVCGDIERTRLQAAQGIHDDIDAAAIVESACADDIGEEGTPFGLDDAEGSDRGDLLRRFSGRSADIDPQVGKFADAAIAFFGGHQVDRFAADDAVDESIGSVEDDAFAGQQLFVDAADGREIEKSVGIDILDEQTDFIAVRIDHDATRRGGVSHDMKISERIEPDRIGIGFGEFGHDPLTGDFGTGRGDGVAEIFQQRKRIHGRWVDENTG